MKRKSKKKLNCKWRRIPKNAPDANVAYDIIGQIKKEKGIITPELLVIEAEKRKSPLHNCFEWDDTKAAKKYRIVQAREILTLIVVEIEPDEDENPRTVRAFIAPGGIEKNVDSSYVTIGQIADDKDMETAYLRQLKRELDSVKNRIKGYKIFEAVVKAIDAIVVP